MDDALPPPPMDALLAERGWAVRVARALVHDEAAADDLAQDAWVAALEARPLEVRSPRAWIATVLRRSAGKGTRGRDRRDRRERAVARPEATRSTADVVAEAEWHRRVVDAVLGLEEPFRATVLLRWFEELPPREVAERMGVPVATVRSRAQRAVEKLRARLDEEHGGSRRAWLVPLAALVGEGVAPAVPGNGPAGGGGAGVGALALTVATRARLGLLGLLLFGGAAVWVAVQRRPTPEASTKPPTAIALAPLATDATSPGLLAGHGRSPMSVTRPGAAALDGTPADEDPAGALEVVDAAGEPVPGPLVQGTGPRGSFTGTGAQTGEGAGVLGTIDVGAPMTVWVSAAGYVSRRLEGLDPLATTRVVLERGTSPALRFTSMGAEVPADEVRRRYEAAHTPLDAVLVADADLRGADVIQGMLRGQFDPPWSWQLRTTIDWSDAGPRLAAAVPAGSWWLVVPRPGLAPALARATLSSGAAPGGFVVDLGGPPRTARVRAVRADTGEPLVGTQCIPYVEIGDDRAFLPGLARSGEGGSAEIDIPADAFPAPGLRAPTWWAIAPRLRVNGRNAIEEADWAAVVDLSAARPGQVLEVRLRPWAKVTGTAWGPDGAPAAGAHVASPRKGFGGDAEVGRDGHFELSIPLMHDASETVSLVLARGSRRREVDVAETRIEAGKTTEVTFGSPKGRAEGGTVRGRLRAGGRPVAGALAMLRPAAGGMVTSAGPLCTTDAEGRFLFEGVVPGPRTLVVVLGDARIVDDFSVESTTPLDVQAGREIPVDLDLPEGVVRVRVVEADGGAASPGAWVIAFPRGGPDETRFPGYRLRPGWSAAADAEGVGLLVGLSRGGLVRVMALRPGGPERDAVSTEVTPGTWESPTEVVLRLPKAP